MNNTKNLLTILAIASLLVMGTSLVQTKSFAGGSEEHKKTKDFKQSIQKDTQSAKASQHQDQDNFCYRGDDCEQANEGQQIVGKDNEANGFNDQSDNIPQSNSSATPSPSTSTSTPTNTTTPSTSPSTQPGAGVTTTTNIIPSTISECSIDQSTNVPVTLTCVR